jgi:hypothetical protein
MIKVPKEMVCKLVIDRVVVQPECGKFSGMPPAGLALWLDLRLFGKLPC